MTICLLYVILAQIISDIIKENIVSKKIDKELRIKIVSGLSTPLAVKEYIVNNPTGYEKSIKAYNPKLKETIDLYYNKDVSFSEKTWHYINQVADEITCNCGKNLRFINVFAGYPTHCANCYKIHRKLNSSIESAKQTQSIVAPTCQHPSCNLPVSKNKSGLWNNHCSTKCKNRHNSLKSREKSKQTMLERHGVEHALQSDDIIEKMKASNLQKHGVLFAGQIKEGIEKRNETCMSRYGVPNATMLPKIQQQIVDSAAVNLGYSKGQFTNISQIPEIFKKKLDNRKISKSYHLPSGRIISLQGYEDLVLDRLLAVYKEEYFIFDTVYSYESSDKTRNYFPDFELYNTVIEVKSDYTFYAEYEKNISKANSVANIKNISFYVINLGNKDKVPYTSILTMNKTIKDLYNAVGAPLHIMIGNYIYDMKLSDNVLLKIFSPMLHTCDHLGKEYFKSVKQDAKNNGFTVIFIDINSITNNFDKIVNFLKYKIGLTTKKIYARQTTVKIITSKEASAFYTTHHLQGRTNASYHIGLIYKDEIVAIMSFSSYRPGIGKNRGPGSYELSRFACNGVVVGAASKLLSYFINHYDVSLIYSYSDSLYSDGNIYEILGFKEENMSRPGYKYILPEVEELLHRFNFSKRNLKKFSNYSDNKTEEQIMIENNYKRVYDAGKKTWIMAIK